MRISGEQLIEAASKANWKDSLGSWVRIAKGVDPVGDCVEFDIKNNKARLISYIDFEMGTVTALEVLTHKDHDKGGWESACNC